MSNRCLSQEEVVPGIVLVNDFWAELMVSVCEKGNTIEVTWLNIRYDGWMEFGTARYAIGYGVSWRDGELFFTPE